MTSLPLYATEPAGLVTKPSSHSVGGTVERFEQAVKTKAANGWMIFTEIDHAEAASKKWPHTEASNSDRFWEPQTWYQANGEGRDVGDRRTLKALVWQDEQDKVWITYNSGDYLMNYVYPRHGLAMPAENATAIDTVIAGFADEATR